MAATMISVAPACDSTRYGSVFPTTNASVEIGAIRTCSIVPLSFSRTMDSAVEITAVIIEMNAIRPGTRKTVLRSSGLYQTRGSTAMSDARTASPPAAAALMDRSTAVT